MKNLNELTPSSATQRGTASSCARVLMQQWKPKSTSASASIAVRAIGRISSYGSADMRYATSVVTPRSRGARPRACAGA